MENGRGTSQRREGSPGIRFQFARGVLHDLNEIRRRSDAVKEILERPGRFERLSFNFRDEQEIFLSSECREGTRRQYEATRESDFDRDNRTNSFA
jgi:hypothetical protein